MGDNVVNSLYYGDNLGYLREMDRESVDLIYLDPPFNSNANYNLLFKSKGNAVQALGELEVGRPKLP
jgi:16S rRNA G966 N2-methylase RsmD